MTNYISNTVSTKSVKVGRKLDGLMRSAEKQTMTDNVNKQVYVITSIPLKYTRIE